MADWNTPAATNGDSKWAVPAVPGYGNPWVAGDGADDRGAMNGAFDGDTNDDGPGGGGGCFNCGETGHNKADCPNPRSMEGVICRACNKDGHMARDCPDKAPMACRRCGEKGHMVAECPQPEICKNCNQEGHGAAGCKSARFIDRATFPDMAPEAAWDLIVTAAQERELDDVKDAVQIYVKANPDTTYVQLEEAFRNQEVGIYLIAIDKPYLAPTLTNMDLQGNMDKKYTVTYRFAPKPTRPRERDMWPETPEQNLERLADAGEVVDRGVSKCSNCNELGHSSKYCPEEKHETPTIKVVKCYNCDGEGHRVRDCPIPRVDRFACKNCGKSGHISKECPEPRSAEGVECRKCNEIGHFSKDCPTGGGGGGCRNCGQEGHKAAECTEPRDMSKVQCRNCDEFGHTGKECPKPRDYSRVKCSNCQEMGHTKVRCKKPLVAEEDDGDRGFGGNDDGESATKGDGDDCTFDDNATAAIDANSAW